MECKMLKLHSLSKFQGAKTLNGIECIVTNSILRLAVIVIVSSNSKQNTYR